MCVREGVVLLDCGGCCGCRFDFGVGFVCGCRGSESNDELGCLCDAGARFPSRQCRTFTKVSPQTSMFV